MRILWLYGPPGVGKSTTAWEVLNLLADDGVPAAYVDIDQLGMVVPAPEDDPHAERLAARALAAVAHVHARRGAATLVVSGVLDVDLMPLYRDLLAPFALAMVRLSVDEVELERRMDARGADAEEWASTLEEARAFEQAALDDPVVVAAGAGPAEVARRVVGVAETVQAATPTAVPQHAEDPEPPGEAVLVGGTTAVGKSSVAWTAFMTLRTEGVPTGFVDLRQMGFVGRDGGPVDHGLQAAVVGAVWPLLRAAGARLLLLNGPVDEPGQVEVYRSALGGTPLTWHRLTASESALATRVRRRGAGDGPARLAGDTLVGLSESDADGVVRRAFGRQRRADELSAAAALDTTQRTVEELAQLVLGRTMARDG